MNPLTPLPEELRRQLASTERALWWGRPRQGLVLRGSDVFHIPFSLLWGGFALFWEGSVLRAASAVPFAALFGVPFVLIGLHMMVGRFFVDAKQRASTWYAVTPERIVIVSGIFSRQVKSLTLRSLTDVSLSEKPGGDGTITFGPQGPFGSDFASMPGMPGGRGQPAPRFELAGDAKSVYETIRQAQRTAS